MVSFASVGSGGQFAFDIHAEPPLSHEYGRPQNVSKPCRVGMRLGRWPRCHLPTSAVR